MEAKRLSWWWKQSDYPDDGSKATVLMMEAKRVSWWWKQSDCPDGNKSRLKIQPVSRKLHSKSLRRRCWQLSGT
jgi:hypothetical protein